MDEGMVVERDPEQSAPPVARRRGPAFLLVVALAIVAVVGLIAILLGTVWWRDGGPGNGPVTISGPLNGRQTAIFELDNGANALRIRATSIDDDLYRVTVPANSDVAPRADENDGDVHLTLNPTNRGGAPGLVTVELNPDVVWILRINAGTHQTVIDMTGGKVDRIDFGGGASQIEVTLPSPSKVVPVQLTAGVDQLLFHLAANTPLRVQFGSGAGRATLYGTTHQGIAPGQSFTTPTWGQSNTGVDIQAQAGVGGLTATTQP